MGTTKKVKYMVANGTDYDMYAFETTSDQIKEGVLTTESQLSNGTDTQLVSAKLIRNALNKKVNQADISNGLTYKGSCLYSELPSSDNGVGDFYYTTDKQHYYTWNGSTWNDTGIGVGDVVSKEEYNELKGDLDSEVTNRNNAIVLERDRAISAENTKINKPTTNDSNKFPRAKNGDVEWVEQGLPTDEQTERAVTKWLNEHPEATTTVQNGSLTSDKFSTEAKEWIRGARVYNIKDYGAVGDGVHNDAPAIRQAIAALPASNFVLYFPPGRYMQGDGTNPDYTRVVNGIPYPAADIGTPLNFVLEDKSNFDIYGYGATIIAHPDNSCIKNTGFFVLTRCSNATVRGFEYIGNISSRAPQWGDGGRYNNQNAFEINGCTDVALYDNHVDGAVMDGYMINKFMIRAGEYIFSERVHLLNCTAINCYRQGLSICGGKNLTIEKCRFSGTGTVYGTAPMNSVDVEATYGSGHFIFKECIFEDSQSGIGINFCDNGKNSVVEDCVFVNDTLSMANSKSASDNSGITIKGCKISNNTIKTATINTEMSCVENNIFDRCILYFTSFKKYGVKSVFRNNMVCFMHSGDFTDTKEVSTALGSKTVVSSQSTPILASGENVEVLMEGNTFINAFGSVYGINKRADVSIDNCIFVCDFDYSELCDYIGINTLLMNVPLGAGNKYDKSVLFLDTSIKNPLNRDSKPLFFYASTQKGISTIDINIGHKTEHYNAFGFFEFFKLSFNGKSVNIIINNNKGQLDKVVIDDNIKILTSDLQFAFAEIDDVRHIYITSSTNSKVNRNYKLEYTTSRGTAHFDNLISVGTTDMIQDGLTWYGEDGEIVS